MSLTGGNRNDVTQLMPLLAKIPSVAGLVGRPRRRPDMLLADRGYDHDKYRRMVWAQGIKPVIARRGVPHGSGLGVHRWVVERTIAWLHGFRHLRVRWERRDDIHGAFLGLAACLITHRHVQRLCQNLLAPFIGLCPRQFGKPSTHAAVGRCRFGPQGSALRPAAGGLGPAGRRILAGQPPLRQLAPLYGVSKSSADRIVDRNAPAMAPQQRTGGGDQRGGGQVRGPFGD